MSAYNFGLRESSPTKL